MISSPRRPARRPRRQPLALERLEDRLAPAIDHWTGAGAAPNLAHPDDDWSNPLNWQGHVTPTKGDILEFADAPAYAKTSFDDLTTVNRFDSIEFGAGGYNVSGNAIQLQNGIQDHSGFNTVGLALTMTADQTYSADLGATLVLSGALDNGGHTATVNANGDVQYTGPSIRGAGGLTMTGDSKFFLEDTAPDSYTGATTVDSGTMYLSGAKGDAVIGAVVIGDGVGSNESDVLRLAGPNQIASGSSLSIAWTGLLDLNGFNNTVGPIAMSGGNITTGGGVLTLAGDVTTQASSHTALVSGFVSLGSGDTPRTFTVASGSTGDADLSVSAAVSGGPGVNLIKSGSGVLLLSGDDANYDGYTRILAGVLAVANAAALGGAPYNGGAGTTVGDGATLQLRALPAGVPYNIEPLILYGAGANGVGALQSYTGANTWQGPIRLNSDATIGCTAGSSFTDGVQVMNEGYTLTVDAVGSVAFSTVLSGAGGLVKTGAGTLTFSGGAPNLYAGATVVNGGTLMLSKPAAVPSLNGSLTINAGGTVAGAGRIDGDVTVNHGGTLNATGVIDGDLENGGVVDPAGPSIVGTLTVNGDYTQTRGGELDIELQSTSAIDQLMISGAASLAGVLRVRLLDGFHPTSGERFTFLEYGSRIGAFGTTDLPSDLALVYDAKDAALAAH